MLKKTLYPFTDWNWLKLPLASFAAGVLFIAYLGLGTGSAYLHSQNPERTAASIQFLILGGGALYMLSILGFAGYLLRVMRQAGTEHPLKLPKWDKPLNLAKDGFLALMGAILLYYALVIVLILVMTPFFLVIIACGDLNGIHAAFGGGIFAHCVFGLMGLVLTVLSLVVGFLVANVIVPLVFVRFANTGRLRDLFSFRWAWRAFTIAPWEYLLRSMGWSLALGVVTALTPLNILGAYAILLLTWPLALIHFCYQLGDYYAEYLDD